MRAALVPYTAREARGVKGKPPRGRRWKGNNVLHFCKELFYCNFVHWRPTSVHMAKNRVQKLRTDAGLTAAALARQLGVAGHIIIAKIRCAGGFFCAR